jgi:hypothetical protein
MKNTYTLRYLSFACPWNFRNLNIYPVLSNALCGKIYIRHPPVNYEKLISGLLKEYDATD